MGKKRDLQKLLELGQIKLDKKTKKVKLRILNDLVDRFATSSIHRDEAEDAGLKSAYESVAGIAEKLYDWRHYDTELEITDYISGVNVMVTNDELIMYRHWEEHLAEQFLLLLNGIKKDDLKICEQCGNLFVEVGHKKKKYCTPRCGVDHHRGIPPYNAPGITYEEK